ncbi:hypothetical protein ScPMuIL_010748 [Solemya velum]
MNIVFFSGEHYARVEGTTDRSFDFRVAVWDRISYHCYLCYEPMSGKSRDLSRDRGGVLPVIIDIYRYGRRECILFTLQKNIKD